MIELQGWAGMLVRWGESDLICINAWVESRSSPHLAAYHPETGQIYILPCSDVEVVLE